MNPAPSNRPSPGRHQWGAKTSPGHQETRLAPSTAPGTDPSRTPDGTRTAQTMGRAPIPAPVPDFFHHGPETPRAGTRTAPGHQGRHQGDPAGPWRHQDTPGEGAPGRHQGHTRTHQGGYTPQTRGWKGLDVARNYLLKLRHRLTNTAAGITGVMLCGPRRF